jgi:hypothetical protein
VVEAEAVDGSAAGTTATVTNRDERPIEKNGRGASREAPRHLNISSKPTLTIAPRFECHTFVLIIRMSDIHRPIE